MKKLSGFVCILLMLFAYSESVLSAGTDIVIENAEMRLVIGSDGFARSLVHKESGSECLSQLQEKSAPVFSVTQYRPYENELQLAYPAKEKSFAADSVRLEGDKLIVTFDLVNYEAIIGLNITDDYIGFSVEELNFQMDSFRKNKKTPIDEMVFLQLPVADRANFGEWLNVMWDDDIAINVLATNPYTRIDSHMRSGYRLLQAGAQSVVKLEGTGAALITTATENLLDRIASVEEDYDLPRGVQSRRSDEYKNSYYELRRVTPHNIDRHIEYARQGGFRAMVVYYPDFATSAGHFPWRTEYPNGMDDLRTVVQKIREAGMTPGFHIHYNKAHKRDPYVTPNPDHRLNLSRHFTLSETLDTIATTIPIHENPQGCTREDNRRILKIGNELITYENYTTESPYRFTGCKRGQLGTTPSTHQAGYLFGLLDVDTWPIFVRFNQNTDIQEEVAQRLGDIYREAGFRFVYFDGAEDVHPPYWYNVSRPQLAVYRYCDPKPIFSEGACKSHFSWHILTRGNAFDIFKPEVVKEATRKHPAAEAPLLAMDFTSIDFGWIGYYPPGDDTIGLQPDMVEYITSRAAAWDSPISLVGVLDQLDAHPRTSDNLEIFRRWEEVRADDYLTDRQKQELRNLDQEHTLLINENDEFELVAYEQIPEVAQGNPSIRAFIFERSGSVWVAFWHTSGEMVIHVPINRDKVKLMEKLGVEIPISASPTYVILPAVNRLYLECELSMEQVVTAFQKATIGK